MVLLYSLDGNSVLNKQHWRTVILNNNAVGLRNLWRHSVNEWVDCVASFYWRQISSTCCICIFKVTLACVSTELYVLAMELCCLISRKRIIIFLHKSVLLLRLYARLHACLSSWPWGVAVVAFEEHVQLRAIAASRQEQLLWCMSV